MWDLLEWLLVLLIELPVDSWEFFEAWRFTIIFGIGTIAAEFVECALDSGSGFIPAAILVGGAILGIAWEWHSRKK